MEAGEEVVDIPVDEKQTFDGSSHATTSRPELPMHPYGGAPSLVQVGCR